MIYKNFKNKLYGYKKSNLLIKNILLLIIIYYIILKLKGV